VYAARAGRSALVVERGAFGGAIYRAAEVANYPGGLPGEIAARWVAGVNKALGDPAVRAKVRDAGFIPGGGSQEDAAGLLRRDAERYAGIIRAAGIRLN
jgi:tripartite-type tricarboxylate transporter receptor subunit TctC